MSEFNERLQFVIKQKGITQENLAQLINVSQASISKMLQGKTRNPRNIIEIAQALGVDPNWLKTGEFPMPNLMIKRLKNALNENEISQEQLANEIGVTQGAISLILRGVTKNSRHMPAIAKTLGVDLNWLLYGEGDNPLGKTCSENRGVGVVTVDVLDVEASAGGGIVPFENAEIVKTMSFDQDFFFQQFHLKDSKGIHLIAVKGDSMQPTIKNNSLVFIDTNIKQFTCDGVYVFSFGENLFIKRLQAVKNSLRVISDNSERYPMWEITGEEMAGLTIHGRVLLGLNLDWVAL